MRNVLAHGPFGGLTSSADRSRRSGGAEGGWSAPLMRRMRMAGMLEAAAIVSTQPDKAHGSKKNRVSGTASTFFATSAVARAIAFCSPNSTA